MPVARVPRKALIAIIFTVCLIVAIPVAGFWGYQRYRYPYGPSRFCSREMVFALREYAQDHGGRYPAGESSPEASLSLLYPEYIDALPLAGRAKSAERAREILESGGLLGPDSCDWHYVEGLTDNAPSEIAIIWCRSSVGHQGQRLNGGHEVVYLDGRPDEIPAEEWDAFLAEQERLVAQFRSRRP
jgi:hypothetical protein